jgi:predicted nucleic-acid-binding protein
VKSLDTNILIRFLIGDSESQAKKVKKLFTHAETSGDKFFIPLLVILEMIWVLDAVYHCSKQDIISSIEHLISMKIFQFEKDNLVNELLLRGKKSNQDLSDILIGLSGKSNKCSSTITFDKKAGKDFSLFELI